jgi:hypothetical protein
MFAYRAIVFALRHVLFPFVLGEVAMQAFAQQFSQPSADSINFASHTRSVLSSLPLTMRVPWAPKATLVTQPSCPRSGAPMG